MSKSTKPSPAVELGKLRWKGVTKAERAKHSQLMLEAKEKKKEIERISRELQKLLDESD
jgi:hypothetical protein